MSRARIVARGLSNACPNCGAHTLFREGSFFRVNSACPACSLVFVADGNEGFSFRASSLNFGATVVLFYGPLLCVALAGWLTEGAAEFVAIAGTVVVPAALYRPSCSWSLTNHYLFFPEDLPANGGGGGESSRPAKADGPA